MHRLFLLIEIQNKIKRLKIKKLVWVINWICVLLNFKFNIFEWNFKINFNKCFIFYVYVYPHNIQIPKEVYKIQVQGLNNNLYEE